MESKVTVGIGEGRSLEVVIAQALDHLADLQYMESTRTQFARCWKRFVRFVRERGGDETRITILGERYQKACARQGDKEYRQPSGQQLTRHAVRVLTEFCLHGCFELRGLIAAKATLPAKLELVVADYRRFSDEHMRHSRATLIVRERDIRRFFRYLEARGIDSVAGIDAAVVSAFLASQAHVQPTSLGSQIGSLRSLMRFLLMRGLVSRDIVDHLGTFRVQRPLTLPSVWRREDVIALLAAVDRGSPVGKRDYAILLLAAQLGIRVGDIRQLRLEHLLWDQARIEFRQSKTGEWLSLPMPEDVGAALIDYLRHGRPPAVHREVFLRAHAPFKPMSLNSRFGHLISRYRQMAGVPLTPPPRWRGLHSLRHSLASRLIEAGTPLEEIAAILGHRCQKSTQSYIRIDVEALRDVALGIEEVCDAHA